MGFDFVRISKIRSEWIIDTRIPLYQRNCFEQHYLRPRLSGRAASTVGQTCALREDLDRSYRWDLKRTYGNTFNRLIQGPFERHAGWQPTDKTQLLASTLAKLAGLLD